MPTKKAPRPDSGNARQGILKPPEPVAVDVAPEPEAAPAPDTFAPGVYSNGVLRANVVDGEIIPLQAPSE